MFVIFIVWVKILQFYDILARLARVSNIQSSNSKLGHRVIVFRFLLTFALLHAYLPDLAPSS